MCITGNEFDPILLRALRKRKAERLKQNVARIEQERLNTYLRSRGIPSVEHDPTLTRVVRPKTK